MTFPAYPGYKDSGVEWLGKVPEHWQAIALSRVLAAPVTDGPHTTPEFLDDGVPFLSVDGIQNGKLNFEGCRYVSFEDHKEFSKKAAPRYNDLLMGKAASVGKIARVTENIEFSIWSPLALIRVDAEQCSPEFLEFCLKSSELQHQILLSSNSNTQLNIGMKDIPKLRIPLPAAQEQTQIARFLDHETARIDVLIEEQQRLIELLKEKRQAVISHAVTKGLDPTVPMKDSGVEWLGEVPAHWVIKKAGFLFEEKNRAVRACDGIVTAFRDGQVCLRSRRRESGFTLADLEHGYQGVRKGDLVLHGMDAFAGAIGVSEDDGRSTPEYVVVEPYDKSMICEYFAHALRVMAERNYILVLCQAVRERAPRFRYSKFSTALLPAPPSGEQEEIYKYISIFSDKCVELIAQAEQQITFLTERRAALISAAVTGKIDVRGWQPPASTQAPKLEVAEAV